MFDFVLYCVVKLFNLFEVVDHLDVGVPGALKIFQDLIVLVGVPIGSVDANIVYTDINELLEYLKGEGGWADGGNYFGFLSVHMLLL